MPEAVPLDVLTSYLVTLGVGGVLAAFMFSVHRKDMIQFLARQEEQTELWRGQTEILVTVIKDVVATNTELIHLVKALHKRLDRDLKSNNNAR